MRLEDVKNILNYYLEYEIYNIANSSQLKLSKKNSYKLIRSLNVEKNFFDK